MSKTTALILIIVTIGGLYIALNLGYLDTLISIMNPNPQQTNPPGFSMRINSQIDNWNQISTTNPTAEYIITIQVTNTKIPKPEEATVYFEITNQTHRVKQGTIDFGVIDEGQQKTITQNHEFQKGNYQASYILKTSQREWDKKTDQFKVDLPRAGLGDHVRYYITPNNPTIQTQLQTTGKDLNTIYNWVAENIQYQYDQDIHGTEEYWQLPHETLDLKTGDCEDQAFLLCSLIRATGTKPEDIFVALGTVENQGHAWVIIRTQLGWRTLEPTIDGITDRIITDIFEFLNIKGRHYYFASNDKYFEEINPTINTSYIKQQFDGWYQNNQRLTGNQITTQVNQSLILKIEITNTGNHTFYGVVQIKIQKDIVMSPDQTLITQTIPVTLNPNNTEAIQLNFTPNQITQDKALNCRHYYYQVSTCFSQIYNPQNQNSRECIYVIE